MFWSLEFLPVYATIVSASRFKPVKTTGKKTLFTTPYQPYVTVYINSPAFVLLCSRLCRARYHWSVPESISSLRYGQLVSN